MSVLRPIRGPDLARYTHRGWFCGLAPVYIGDVESDCPLVAVRNGVPDIVLDLVEGLWSLFALVHWAIGAREPLAWPLLLTGRLDEG